MRGRHKAEGPWELGNRPVNPIASPRFAVRRVHDAVESLQRALRRYNDLVTEDYRLVGEREDE